MATGLVSFSRLLNLPENHSALLAVQDLAVKIASGHESAQPSPIYLYGPAGTGKTCLVKALQAEVLRRNGKTIIGSLSAKELEASPFSDESVSMYQSLFDEIDLLILEDVHQLSPRWADPVAAVIDSMQARQVPVVVTASAGPGFLRFPRRLTSRLASGLVIELKSLQAPSRLRFLQTKAQAKQLAVRPEVLAWLADHLRGSCRELEGALSRLETLGRHQRLVDVATVARHFQDELDVNKSSLDRIMQQVSDYFHVPIGQLFSDRRDRRVLLPRQIGMYLARQLTPLSFQEIGARLGGRDHSTVLHGCRKIARALNQDVALAGTVHQLQVSLT